MKPRIFIGVEFDYIGTFSAQIKQTDGTNVGSSYSLSSAVTKKERFIFASPVSDIALTWVLTSYSEVADKLLGVKFIPLELQTENLQTFRYIEIEHTTAVTFSVYDSGDAVKMSGKTIPINSTGRTVIALSSPFTDYYGYIRDITGTIKNYRLLTDDSFTGDLLEFVSADIKYDSTVTVDFKETDGTSILAAPLALTSKTTCLERVYFPYPVVDTSLTWALTSYLGRVTGIKFNTRMQQDHILFRFTKLLISFTGSIGFNVRKPDGTWVYNDAGTREDVLDSSTTNVTRTYHLVDGVIDTDLQVYFSGTGEILNYSVIMQEMPE